MLSRHSNSRFSSITTNRVYLIFLAVTAGIAVGCLPFAGSVFAVVSESTGSMRMAAFCGCVFLLLLVSVCGLSVVGIPCVLTADAAFGFLVSASCRDFRISDFFSSSDSALLFLTVYVLAFSCIFISDSACGFSKELYRHIRGSNSITSDMFKYALAVTVVMVFLVILLLLQIF